MKTLITNLEFVASDMVGCHELVKSKKIFQHVSTIHLFFYRFCELHSLKESGWLFL